jgi:hypothetical protein
LFKMYMTYVFPFYYYLAGYEDEWIWWL